MSDWLGSGLYVICGPPMLKPQANLNSIKLPIIFHHYDHADENDQVPYILGGGMKAIGQIFREAH